MQHNMATIFSTSSGFTMTQQLFLKNWIKNNFVSKFITWLNVFRQANLKPLYGGYIVSQDESTTDSAMPKPAHFLFPYVWGFLWIFSEAFFVSFPMYTPSSIIIDRLVDLRPIVGVYYNWNALF